MNIVLILQTSQVFNDRENRQLVTNEPVEVRDCRKITDHFRRIYRIYPNLIKENRRMRTCHRFGFANTRISTGYAQKSSQSLRVLSTKNSLSTLISHHAWKEELRFAREKTQKNMP